MSKVSIVNSALSLLGSRAIVNLADESQEASLANKWFDISLQSVLSESLWRFATKRSLLNKVSETPAWGLGNYFLIPSDCVKVFSTNTDMKWSVEGDYILCDVDSIGILYTRMIEDTTKFPIWFEEALSYKLASDMCFELNNSSSKREELLRVYNGQILPLAKSKNSQDKSGDEVKDNYWVNSVYGTRWG